MRIPSNPSVRRSRAALLLGAAATGSVLAGCDASNGAADPDRPESAAEAFGHIHSLDVNPADDKLYVATHQGLFVLGSGGFDRVGEGRYDAMSFTIAGPDRFLMSGHPEPGAGAPPHLGLTESEDAGVSWQSVALEGAADFHALEAAGDRVYGVDSQTGRLMLTDDGEQWRDLGPLPAADVAVDPGNRDLLLLTDGRGALVRLEVSGRPSLVETAPRLTLLDWVSEDLLVGVGPEGTVHRSDDDGQSWQEVGALPDVPHALTATESRWYAATEGGVLVSEDAGRTWSEVAAG